jgi:hypothetical protein
MRSMVEGAWRSAQTPFVSLRLPPPHPGEEYLPFGPPCTRARASPAMVIPGGVAGFV